MITKKWYDDTTLLTISLLVVYPIGIYGLFKSTRYNNKEKEWISAFYGYVFAFVVLLIYYINHNCSSPTVIYGGN